MTAQAVHVLPDCFLDRADSTWDDCDLLDKVREEAAAAAASGGVQLTSGMGEEAKKPRQAEFEEIRRSAEHGNVGDGRMATEIKREIKVAMNAKPRLRELF